MSVRHSFVQELGRRFGPLRQLPNSRSLYELGGAAALVYVRYSKVHGGRSTFYGLRSEDIRRLSGHAAYVCFLWDGQREPLLVPLDEYEDVLSGIPPAGDGQYKAQVHFGQDRTELYLARAGRFSVDGNFGWGALERRAGVAGVPSVPDLSHRQVQALLGAIGAAKGCAVWVPPEDRAALDWALAGRFSCAERAPELRGVAGDILRRVDVVWLKRGAPLPSGLFEVEHSTPVYSGLLRLNDVLLALPSERPSMAVVARDSRRAVFAGHINRPTFRASGLDKLCSFLNYEDVFRWHDRVCANAQ